MKLWLATMQDRVQSEGFVSSSYRAVAVMAETHEEAVAKARAAGLPITALMGMAGDVAQVAVTANGPQPTIEAQERRAWEQDNRRTKLLWDTFMGAAVTAARYHGGKVDLRLWGPHVDRERTLRLSALGGIDVQILDGNAVLVP